MNSLFSKSLANITPYVAGEQPQDRSYIKLNTNENPFPPSELVLEKINTAAKQGLQRYPDPECKELKSAIADYYNLGYENVFVGNGSDEVLAHSFKAFFEQDDPIAFPDISYSFYPVFCQHYAVSYNMIPVSSDLSIDLNDYPERNGGIIFANPNAPTGHLLSLQEIRTLLDRNNGSVVIVDEAYGDFAEESCVSLIADYKNLLVIKTVSKSRSLAGIRVGYALGDPELITALATIKDSFNSYPLDTLAMAAAIAAFDDQEYFKECRDKLIENRIWLSNQLHELGFDLIPSRANFVFARHSSIAGENLYLQLKEMGILVRYFSQDRINNYVRISIGTREDLQQLVNSCKTILVDP